MAVIEIFCPQCGEHDSRDLHRESRIDDKLKCHHCGFGCWVEFWKQLSCQRQLLEKIPGELFDLVVCEEITRSAQDVMDAIANEIKEVLLNNR